MFRGYRQNDCIKKMIPVFKKTYMDCWTTWEQPILLVLKN